MSRIYMKLMYEAYSVVRGRDPFLCKIHQGVRELGMGPLVAVLTLAFSCLLRTDEYWSYNGLVWRNVFAPEKERSGPRELAMVAENADMVKPLFNGQAQAMAGGSPIQGGWITFPFIAGSIMSTVVASGGAMGNFIVYLITEFNMSSVEAAQISNVINGCINLTPVAGAIVADAFFGSYPVIVVSSFVNLLAMILFTLTATLRPLRPSACLPGAVSCAPATAGQVAVLYSALALLAVGTGGARFNTMTMGADQFDRSDQREVFFNWIFLIIYVSSIIGSTAIVYLEDSLSWGVGFGICTALAAGGLGMLLAGARFYRRTKAQGSAFTGPARVLVAAVRKRKTPLSLDSLDGFYCGAVDGSSAGARAPTQSLRFLNHAAVIVEGDIGSDGSVRHPWRLCAVEQVEDLKVLLRLFPLWSSSIFLSVPLGIQFSLSVLQALAMDRSLGRHFSVPAGSILVANLAAVAISLPIIDRLVPELCRRFAGGTPTPIHRIGAGHIFNIAGMAASALVERRRLGIVHSHASSALLPGWIAPMSAMWLVLPLAVSGIGEALHFPGQISLYYQEFPISLRSTAAAMVALLIAIGFYLSTAVVDLVRRTTTWLPDNANAARIDDVFWLMTIVGAINFAYFLVCAFTYKYREIAEQVPEDRESNPILAGYE